MTLEGCYDLARIRSDFDRTAGSSSSRNPLLGYGAQDPLEYCDDSIVGVVDAIQNSSFTTCDAAASLEER